jgi:hypothetical protein
MRVWDFVCCFIFRTPFLDLDEGFLELFTSFCSKLFGWCVFGFVYICLLRGLCKFLLQSFTMWPIFYMMCLEFTGVSLPSEILIINERNCLIGFIRSCMFHMCIKSFCWTSFVLMCFCLRLWVYLNIIILHWLLCDNLILAGNYS